LPWKLVHAARNSQFHAEDALHDDGIEACIHQAEKKAVQGIVGDNKRL
jgi:hypothetical protein